MPKAPAQRGIAVERGEFTELLTDGPVQNSMTVNDRLMSEIAGQGGFADAVRANQHGAAQAVIQNDPRDAVPCGEGAKMAAQEIFHAGAEEEARKDVSREAEHHDEGHQGVVRTCRRYLSARKDQLNYREAIAEGIPIGSCDIESAHRYVAQKRLKLPGAWWLVQHAEHMLALRINRLNGDWEAYWAALSADLSAPANLNQPKMSSKVAG